MAKTLLTKSPRRAQRGGVADSRQLRIGLRHSDTYREELAGPRWKNLRDDACRRSEPAWPTKPARCEWCRRPETKVKLELHHRRGYGRMGRVELKDVVLLCKRHHVRIEERRRRRRRRQGAVSRVQVARSDSATEPRR